MFFWDSLAFFDDPTDVGNLISGSSAFSKSNLNIWKFAVHVLLKPGLENLEQYFASMWDECNRVVVWAFIGIAFLWDWNWTDLFKSCGHCWVFQIWWYIEPWCWRRLLRVPWTARRSNQSILKEIRPEYSGRTDAEAETPVLWPPDAKNWLIWKDPDAGKDWGQEKGTTEDEMIGWHHWVNGHESE